ncbi:MAG: radical SAM protein [Desulfobacterales bacterium]|nr:radical SAM protein [Desulfobacterales bacterium]
MSTLFSTRLITFSQSLSSYQCDCDIHSSTQMISSQHASTEIAIAYLELTPTCNNRCVGCGNVFISNKLARKMKIDTAPLSIPEWRKILDKLAPRINHLNITGGEPTLYKHFVEFINLINEYRFKLTLFTNARWRKPQETVKTIAQLEGLKGLLISLHGKDAVTHETFTLISGSHNETIENIKSAINADISITLCSVITRYNYAQIRDIYQLGEELGVPRVVFNRYIGLPQDDCAPTTDQFKQALIEIEAMRVEGASVKLSVATPQCFHPTSTIGCEAGNSFITVDPWGNIKPCNHTSMTLGNLCCDSLDEVIDSKELEYWRNFIPTNCYRCSAFTICGGGCKAEAMLNQTNQDSLIQLPFLPKDKTEFLVLPDNLRPTTTTTHFDYDDFFDGIDCQTRHILTNSLDGAATLKELGVKYGQNMLNLIGTMYKEGVVEFM